MKKPSPAGVPPIITPKLALAVVGVFFVSINGAFSEDLPVSCVKRENARLMDASRPLPPTSYLVDFVNSCGKCIDLTTAPKKNGSYTDFGMTWEHVSVGAKRTGRYAVDGVGVFSLDVTSVKTSTCNE